jgi:predicted Zn finger-like uncharacterized protein
MDLYTRCPNCDTTFRVTTQQLQASGGQVRCGHCQKIFDAFATLTAQEPRAAPEDPADPAVAPQDSRGDGNAQSSIAEASDFAEDQAPSARPDPAADLYEWEFRMPEPPRRSALWTVLTLVTATVLAAQAAYAFRNEVMLLAPQTRGYYARLCESAGCVVGLPKLSNYLHIEASDMKATDPSHPNEIQLLLSVRNRAPVDLAYPAFELTLTDALEQPLLRRVFLPAEYLPPMAQAGGLKAGTEMPIQLYLDTGSVRAAGYRFYLFYP